MPADALLREREIHVEITMAARRLVGRRERGREFDRVAALRVPKGGRDRSPGDPAVGRLDRHDLPRPVSVLVDRDLEDGSPDRDASGQRRGGGVNTCRVTG